MFSPAIKILCPVCGINIKLINIKEHMHQTDETHKKFTELFIDENTYKILGKSTNVKNIFDNIYFNWDYNIQLKYKVSEKDINNYNNALQSVKDRNMELTTSNIMNTMVVMDELYSMPRLLPNIICIIQNNRLGK